jgi:Group II intron, maturase-specific domain
VPLEPGEPLRTEYQRFLDWNNNSAHGRPRRPARPVRSHARLLRLRGKRMNAKLRSGASADGCRALFRMPGSTSQPTSMSRSRSTTRRRGIFAISSAGYPRHDWLMAAVEKRLREELAELQVEINEEKSRVVDLGRGESFAFLGFDFRRIRSRRGAWRANYTPQLKKRTALQRKLKDVFRRHQSQPVDRVVQLINPVLRGWVNYFAVGHSSECFSFIKDWVEKKVRRHMLRARKRKGFGWTRWSRPWLYETLWLFNGYRVRRPLSKVAPAG